MSVLIKGMEMPKSCFECFAFNAENTYCALYSHGIPARHSLKPYEKPEWCELIEVPTPYGPLVDSNRLIDIGLHLMHTAKNDDIANGVKWLWQYIIESPTIIESEGEDESR